MQLVRVWDIPIQVHLSWLLIWALLTASLAAGYFPAEYPGWAAPAYWLVAALTALVFFGCILVHELGHAWVALRNGIPIRSITLFVFGGIARIAREPASPGVEFRVAIAGPLVSLGLAACGWLLWAALRGVPALAAPAVWLARINFMVAAFNLIPGFPLDGGRVFRALVWRWTGSFQRATRAASASGQLVAFGLIGWGALVALGGNLIGGLWMVFIGWFLQSAAAGAQAEAGLRTIMREARVEQAMSRECPRVPRDWTLGRLVRDEVLGAGRRCFVVADDGRLRGLLTLHEVKAVPHERWEEVRVGEVMTPVERVTAVGPQDDLLEALERMDDARVAQMPVVAGETLVGMIGREEILHYVRVRAELGL